MIVSMSKAILCVVRDLLLSSKITSAIKAANLPYKLLREASLLESESEAELLIVDLNLEGAIAAAAKWLGAHPVRAVGFVSHTDSVTIAAARAAGIPQILPRSRFFESLPEILVQE